MTGSQLTQRAHGQDVERRPEGPTLADQIRSMESQYALAMPKGAEAAQLVRDALTLIRSTPKLAECQPATVLGGLMTFAQLGLRPGVLGHGWLLPFWDSKSRTNKAQVVIGYQGFVELAHRSGRIKSLIARTVYANDTFDVAYGLDDVLVHKPVLKGSRGEPVAYYAVAKFTEGGHAFFVMTHDEMVEYRDRYAMARTKGGVIVGPWKDQFEAMAQKTTVRQLAKWLPKSTEFANAIEIDNGVRVSVDPTADLVDTTHHYDNQDDPQRDTVDGEVVDEAVDAPEGVDVQTGEVTEPEGSAEA